MIHMPIEDIVSKIKEQTGLSEESIQDQIKVKMRLLEGLVSEEGAAYIVASDLGVSILKNITSSGPVKIKDILPGMMSVDTTGKITKIFPVVSFTKKDQTKGEVASMIINDGTDFSRVVIWDQRVDWVKEGKLSEGTIIRVKDGLVKEGKFGGKEIHINKRSSIVINPAGVEIEVKMPAATSKKINELRDGDIVNFLATVVQVFPPKFYPTCPVCNKKAATLPEGVKCLMHKDAQPVQSMILNFVLDDNTDTIRAVAFRDIAELLAGSTAKDFQESFSKDGEIIIKERLDAALLGKTIEVNGKVANNVNFDRLELRVNKAEINPNAKNLAAKLLSKK